MRFDSKDGRLRGRKAQERRFRLWSADPCCAKCGALTEWPSGFEADHITPLSFGGKDVESNLQVLCAGPTGCHAKKTIAEGHGDPAVSFFPEWLEPSASRLTIVFGPPGAGKSKYVEDTAASDDIKIDLDGIISDLSGLPLYHAGDEWLRRGVHFRNRLLAGLSKNSDRAAWFITSGLRTDRDWWVQKLSPTSVVLLNTGADTCKKRVKADNRRPRSVVDRHIKAIDHWWSVEIGLSEPANRRRAVGVDGWPIG